MNDIANVGPSLSADEAKFFETGGESPIPAETSGADTTTTDGSAAADAGTDKPAAGEPKTGKDAADKTVPLNALHEERTKRKALDTQLREAQQKLANFEGRFAIIEKLNGGQQQETQQPAAPPTVDDDIFGNVKHVGETVEQIKKRLDDADAAKKAETEHTTFVNSYKADAAKFMQATPDYMDAYNLLLSSRAAELQAIGYEGQDLANALQADEVGIAQMAMSKGKSPAEMIYALAKQRGYTKKEADAAAAAAASSGAEKLEAIERGQAANKSLANTGGNAGDQDMTAERLLSMPIGDFEAWCEKNPTKARRIMGG